MAGRVRHCVVPGIISPDPAGVTMVISQTAGPVANHRPRIFTIAHRRNLNFRPRWKLVARLLSEQRTSTALSEPELPQPFGLAAPALHTRVGATLVGHLSRSM
jgi:hypothetical protein